MEICPFLTKSKKGIFLRLHKKIYDKAIIEQAEKEEPEMVRKVLSKKDYYLVELNVEENADYFDFLNYLIYLKRAQ